MMKQAFKRVVLKLYTRAGLYKLIRSFGRRQHIILTFHKIRSKNENVNLYESCPSVSSEAFEKILLYVSNRFRIVTLKELCDHRASSEPLAAITFDDGWRDNFTNAFPILKKLSIPATIFVATEKIGSYQPFWQQQLGVLFSQAYKNPTSKAYQFVVQLINLKTGKSISYNLYLSTIKKFKQLSHDQIRREMKQIEIYNNSRGKKRCFLSHEEISEMSNWGIEFGSHTVNHVILTNEKRSVIDSELNRSRNMLKEITGKQIDTISYPNGNYTDIIIGLSKAAGYRVGCTTKLGCVGKNCNPLTLPRIDADWDDLCDELYYVKSYLFNWITR